MSIFLLTFLHSHEFDIGKRGRSMFHYILTRFTNHKTLRGIVMNNTKKKETIYKYSKNLNGS